MSEINNNIDEKVNGAQRAAEERATMKDLQHRVKNLKAYKETKNTIGLLSGLTFFMLTFLAAASSLRTESAFSYTKPLDILFDLILISIIILLSTIIGLIGAKTTLFGELPVYKATILDMYDDGDILCECSDGSHKLFHRKDTSIFAKEHEIVVYAPLAATGIVKNAVYICHYSDVA